MAYATYIMGIHSVIARHIAARYSKYVRVLDCCAGAGTMTRALATFAKKVIALEKSPEVYRQLVENTKGISEIETYCGSTMDHRLLNSLSPISAAFLDPEWSTTKYPEVRVDPRLAQMDPPADALFECMYAYTHNICLRLPRELSRADFEVFPEHEREAVYLNGQLKFYCLYFGGLRNDLRESAVYLEQ